MHIALPLNSSHLGSLVEKFGLSASKIALPKLNSKVYKVALAVIALAYVTKVVFKAYCVSRFSTLGQPANAVIESKSLTISAPAGAAVESNVGSWAAVVIQVEDARQAVFVSQVDDARQAVFHSGAKKLYHQLKGLDPADVGQKLELLEILNGLKCTDLTPVEKADMYNLTEASRKAALCQSIEQAGLMENGPDYTLFPWLTEQLRCFNMEKGISGGLVGELFFLQKGITELLNNPDHIKTLLRSLPTVRAEPYNRRDGIYLSKEELSFEKCNKLPLPDDPSDPLYHLWQPGSRLYEFVREAQEEGCLVIFHAADKRAASYMHEMRLMNEDSEGARFRYRDTDIYPTSRDEPTIQQFEDLLHEGKLSEPQLKYYLRGALSLVEAYLKDLRHLRSLYKLLNEVRALGLISPNGEVLSYDIGLWSTVKGFYGYGYKTLQKGILHLGEFAAFATKMEGGFFSHAFLDEGIWARANLLSCSLSMQCEMPHESARHFMRGNSMMNPGTPGAEPKWTFPNEEGAAEGEAADNVLFAVAIPQEEVAKRVFLCGNYGSRVRERTKVIDWQVRFMPPFQGEKSKVRVCSAGAKRVPR